jgi:hypothetical protein
MLLDDLCEQGNEIVIGPCPQTAFGQQKAVEGGNHAKKNLNQGEPELSSRMCHATPLPVHIAQIYVQAERQDRH